MNRITVKQISSDEICLDDIRRIFFETGIKTVADFRAKKASGELQVPSRDNLNALCKEKKGKSFELFFFGGTKSKLGIETDLIAHEMTGSMKEPGNQTKTTTPGNYAEYYMYKTPGSQKNSTHFSAGIFDENFINTLLEWCIDNKISTKNEYISKKPVYFPSLGSIRQLAYLKEVLNIDFKN